MAKTLEAVVSGAVQGVFYRVFVLERARALGLVGEVTNLSDGTVRVRAQGSEEALTSFLADLKEGPREASVSSVEVRWEDVSPFQEFSIYYP